ncbi:MAG: replication-relaxation family protein, partial [Planctomycetales bacterium]|nr:replication-relaxation family protein [Planctomycetales bacterium]
MRLLDRTPATAELIRLASVSFPGGPFRDPRRVRERLNALAHMRLVSSFSATQGIGGPINWYKLTQDGFRLLYGPDVTLPHRSRFTATSPSRFHHMQTLAEVIVHLLAAAHRARVTVTRFFGDGELMIEGAGRKLQPDCFFQLQQAGRQFNFMVEVDHATEPLDSHSAHAVRQKIEVYESHQDTTWQWWKQQPPGTPRSYFRVLFLTTTAECASHFLCLACECARNRDRRLCYA